MTIELGTDNFNRVEALEGGIPRSLLVLGKQSSHVLLVSFSDFECTLQSKLEIPSKLENRIILDVCIWDNKAAFLFDKNVVAVFELTTRTVVFKASYAEATDNISRIFFISDRISNPTSEQQGLLSGFFLLAETKVQVVKKDPASSQKESRTNMLRKLHLVELLQTESKIKKVIARNDKLE